MTPHKATTVDDTPHRPVAKPGAVTLLRVLLWIQFARAVTEVGALAVLVGGSMAGYREYLAADLAEYLENPPVVSIWVDAGLCAVLAVGALLVNARPGGLRAVIVAVECGAIVNLALSRPFSVLDLVGMGVAVTVMATIANHEARAWWRDK